MDKTIAVVIAMLVVGGAAYWLFAKGPAVPPAQTSPEASASAASVSIQDFAFSPAALSTKAGATVTWTNNDTVPHTVTSDSGLFDSKTLAPGQSWSYTFTAPGTVSYYCAIHPMMKGSITVSN